MSSGSSDCSFHRWLFYLHQVGKQKWCRFRNLFTTNEGSFMIKFWHYFSLLFWSENCCIFSSDYQLFECTTMNTNTIFVDSLCPAAHIMLYHKKFLLTSGKINSLILNVSILLRLSGLFLESHLENQLQWLLWLVAWYLQPVSNHFLFLYLHSISPLLLFFLSSFSLSFSLSGQHLVVQFCSFLFFQVMGRCPSCSSIQK